MAIRKRKLHTATGQEVREDQVYEALDSFFCGSWPTAIVRGERLRGTHPAVVASPSMFVEDGLSNDELTNICQRRFPTAPAAEFQPIPSRPAVRPAGAMIIPD